MRRERVPVARRGGRLRAARGDPARAVRQGDRADRLRQAPGRRTHLRVEAQARVFNLGLWAGGGTTEPPPRALA